MVDFVYKPEVDYSLISAENSEQTNKYLADFKKGLLVPLEVHIMNADGLRKFINSQEVPLDVREEYRDKDKEIDDALAGVIRTYSELETETNERQLESTANREYFKHFKDANIDPAKLNYIKLLRSYELMKIANLKFIEYWDTIIRIFKAVKHTGNSDKFLEQVLVFRAFPRRETCDMVSLFLRRLSYLLRINKEEIKYDSVIASGVYTSQVSYTLSAIFREDLDRVISSVTTQNVAGNYKKTQVSEIVEDTAIIDEYTLDTQGNEAFNQGYFHIISIKPNKFEVELEKIRKAIYIETHLGAEEDALRQDLIRKFISHAKSKDRIKEYENFLVTYFGFIKDTLTLQFTNFTESDKLLYLYHFGPVFFLKVVIHYMREGKTGYVHRNYTQKTMLRELPFEYVKYFLKTFWDNNVYKKTTKVDRNSYDSYQMLKTSVRNIWREEQAEVLQKIQSEQVFLRAFKLHDLASLKPFLVHELSYSLHVSLIRFLGADYLYMPVHRSKK